MKILIFLFSLAHVFVLVQSTLRMRGTNNNNTDSVYGIDSKQVIDENEVVTMAADDQKHEHPTKRPFLDSHKNTLLALLIAVLLFMFVVVLILVIIGCVSRRDATNQSSGEQENDENMVAFYVSLSRENARVDFVDARPIDDWVKVFGETEGRMLYEQVIVKNELPSRSDHLFVSSLKALTPLRFWVDQIKKIQEDDPDKCLNTIGSIIGHDTTVWIASNHLPAKQARKILWLYVRFLSLAKPYERIELYDRFPAFRHAALGDPMWDRWYWSEHGGHVVDFMTKLTRSFHISALPVDHAGPDAWAEAFGAELGHSLHNSIAVEDQMVDDVASFGAISPGKLAGLVSSEYWLEQVMRARDAGNIHHDTLMRIASAIGAERTAYLSGLVFTEEELPAVMSRILPDYQYK